MQSLNKQQLQMMIKAGEIVQETAGRLQIALFSGADTRTIEDLINVLEKAIDTLNALQEQGD